MALISVVVPIFNGDRFLAWTIDSVREQLFNDWELILVDDGSDDQSHAVAGAYATTDRRVRLIRQRNSGVAAARNRGYRGADRASRFVIFLDHDDILERDALQRLLAIADTAPRAVAISGLSRTIDCAGEPIDPGELEQWGRRRLGVVGKRLGVWPIQAPTTFAVLVYQNCIYTPGQVLIRCSALDRVGAFDESIAPCDDWDMWLRLSRQGEIAFLDRVVLNWRRHDNLGSRQKERIAELQAEVRRRLLRSSEISPAERQITSLANRAWNGHIGSKHLHRTRTLLRCGDVRGATRALASAARVGFGRYVGIPAVAPVFWPTVKELYRRTCTTPSDIQAHLPTLRALARDCRHVTEFGTRMGTSTTAFLSASPAYLVCYDLQRLASVEVLERAALQAGKTRFVFHQADVRELEIGDTDLLFIDTWHVYEQLREELALHADKVRKYLVFHDTTTYGEQGETPGHRGLWPAIKEFLQTNPDWTLAARYTHCNGLTILKRTGKPARQPSENADADSYTRPGVVTLPPGR
jgi:glycosyltransferase involved in cell wall biosynthesis